MCFHETVSPGFTCTYLPTEKIALFLFCHGRGTGSKAELVEEGQDRILGFKHSRGILDQAGQGTKRSRKARLQPTGLQS